MGGQCTSHSSSLWPLVMHHKLQFLQVSYMWKKMYIQYQSKCTVFTVYTLVATF